MNRIAAVDGGTYFHKRTLYDSPYEVYFDDYIYAPDLADTNLEAFDCLFVTSRQDGDLMANAKSNIEAFLNSGKTVIAMGETNAWRWLPNIDWQPTEVNFWWWLDKEAESGLTVKDPEHSLFEYLTLNDATWHQHGYFNAPEKSRSLIEIKNKGSILYDDQSSTPGRIIATTLDPCYHHGSFFMPSTTKFLNAFLPWLKAQK